jgi:hypothetical protein
MKKEEFYEVKWTFSCKMEELISRAARNPGLLALMDEIRIQSNAQHLFHKKQRLSAFIHCTSVQWVLARSA